MGRNNAETAPCVAVLYTRSRASTKVIVCYDRGVGRVVVSSYELSKFAMQCVDFWAPDKTGQK